MGMQDGQNRAEKKYRENFDSSAFGKWIREARRGAGIRTLDELAEKTGISKSALQRIEAGERDMTISQLCAISSAVLGELPSLVYDGIDLVAACVDKSTAAKSEYAKSLRIRAAAANITAEILALAGAIDPNTKRVRTTPEELRRFDDEMPSTEELSAIYKDLEGN